MTTLALNELSRAVRQQLGLDSGLDCLPPDISLHEEGAQPGLLTDADSATATRPTTRARPLDENWRCRVA